MAREALGLISTGWKMTATRPRGYCTGGVRTLEGAFVVRAEVCMIPLRDETASKAVSKTVTARRRSSMRHREEWIMDYGFEIVETGAQPALSIRTVTSVGNLPQELGKAFHAIMAYMEELGEKPEEAAFAAYHNMDMENLDVEMGFPVRKTLLGRGQIVSSEIPAGRKATYLYKGPYREMEPVYRAMTEWIAENGHQPTGVVYEFYYNSPLEVPESELLTKIVFPLR